MRRGAWAKVVLTLFGLMTGVGCAGTEARYVYQDGSYGVVGIPQNTSRWPNFYRDQAEALMRQHFPGGYEVVRAEEVVEGSRTLTVGDSGTAELAPVLATPLLKIGKLGLSSSVNRSDSVKIKECRIIYKRSPGSADHGAGYAPEPTAAPTCYVDPNAAARRGEKPADDEPTRLSKHVVAKPKADASGDGAQLTGGHRHETAADSDADAANDDDAP